MRTFRGLLNNNNPRFGKRECKRRIQYVLRPECMFLNFKQLQVLLLTREPAAVVKPSGSNARWVPLIRRHLLFNPHFFVHKSSCEKEGPSVKDGSQHKHANHSDHRSLREKKDLTPNSPDETLWDLQSLTTVVLSRRLLPPWSTTLIDLVSFRL